MEKQYVKLSDLSIKSHGSVQRTNSIYKNSAFTTEELAGIGYALLDESAPVGYRPTGKAVLSGGIYQREYVDQTPEEAAAQAKRALKLSGVAFEGVMCSATAQDMWGLAAIRDYVAGGASTPFEFDNGNVLTLTPDNMAAFRATWEPFRASFFG